MMDEIKLAIRDLTAAGVSCASFGDWENSPKEAEEFMDRWEPFAYLLRDALQGWLAEIRRAELEKGRLAPSGTQAPGEGNVVRLKFGGPE
jgi:hypothetical protein